MVHGYAGNDRVLSVRCKYEAFLTLHFFPLTGRMIKTPCNITSNLLGLSIKTNPVKIRKREYGRRMPL